MIAPAQLRSPRLLTSRTLHQWTNLNDHIALFAAINACDACLSRVLGGQEGRCAGCGEVLPVGTPIVYLVHGEAAEEGRGDYHVKCFETWAIELLS